VYKSATLVDRAKTALVTIDVLWRAKAEKSLILSSNLPQLYLAPLWG